MKTNLKRIAHLLLVLVVAFSIFTGGLLLNAHPSYARIQVITAPQPGLGAYQVKQVQTALNANGANPPLSVDGIFGPITRDAAIAFEDKNGLTHDDIDINSNLLDINSNFSVLADFLGLTLPE